MDKTRSWKNFTLGEELHIAGRFIYNGLRSFHEMNVLHNDDEAFEVLYQLSVGFERLLKVAVILIEHDDTLDQEHFEQSLITHSHLDLLARVTKKASLTPGGPSQRISPNAWFILQNAEVRQIWRPNSFAARR